MGASPYLSHLPLADVSSPLAKSITPAPRASFLLAKSTTPAVAGSIRRLPGVASQGCATLTPGCVLAPFQGAHSHRQINNARRGGLNTPPSRGCFPGLRYAYPGLCSGALSGRSFPSPRGGRQAGGEVIPLARVQASRSRNRAPFSCRS